jgi:hypothetical protein
MRSGRFFVNLLRFSGSADSLGGELSAQGVGGRDSDHQFARHFLFGAGQFDVAELEQRYGGID